MPVPRDAFTPFLGGLDLETPPWLTLPGTLRDTYNYEVAIEGGYRDIKGYERFDGQPKPSDASYTVLDVNDSSLVHVGDVIVGSSSGATGVVIATGIYPDSDQEYLVITKVTGTFTTESLGASAQSFDDAAFDTDAFSIASFELVTVGSSTSITDTPYSDSAPLAKLKAQYKNLAADAYRADIDPVPGEGPVWGGFSLGDDKYAIRNKVGGMTAGIYKATSLSWDEVDLGRELVFTSGGTTEITENASILGTTSNATAVVRRVQLTSGSWAGGDAAGILTLVTQTGTFQAENLTFDGDINSATIAGDSTAIALEPDGRLDYYKSNFADTQGPDRIYGADGVNYGWEFGGDAIVFIRTGMEDDTPDHVIVHKNKLFFSFAGSVQHSSEGDPIDWEVVLGAAELATGAVVTGFQKEPGSAGNATLLIGCESQMFILYGSDVVDWNLVAYRERIGAYEWTLQTLASTLFLDNAGITDLQTAQAYGNFSHSALSSAIQSLVTAKRTLATASCVARDKSQYRLFFTDRTGIYVTILGSKLLGMMPVTLSHQITTMWNEPNLDGDEEIFFGSDDGYVYQMERGTSFDGENIRAFLFTHFDHSKMIGRRKSYFSPVTLEAKGTGYAEFALGYALDYGASGTPQPNDQTANLSPAEATSWDSSVTWDSGVQFDDSSFVPTVGLDLRGEGQNISWAVTKDSDYMEPLLLSGVHFKMLPTRQIRG